MKNRARWARLIMVWMIPAAAVIVLTGGGRVKADPPAFITITVPLNLQNLDNRVTQAGVVCFTSDGPAPGLVTHTQIGTYVHTAGEPKYKLMGYVLNNVDNNHSYQGNVSVPIQYLPEQDLLGQHGSSRPRPADLEGLVRSSTHYMCWAIVVKADRNWSVLHPNAVAEWGKSSGADNVLRASGEIRR